MPSHNALFIYDEFSKRLIYGIKYRSILSSISWIADQYISKIPSDLDLITWIPASKPGKQKRGYDQCRLLAEAISVPTGIPFMPVLARQADVPQTHSKSLRHLGPKLHIDKFFLRRVGKQVQGNRPNLKVLLLDDVITTGTSIRKGKNLLEEAGMFSVSTFGIAKVDNYYLKELQVRDQSVGTKQVG